MVRTVLFLLLLLAFVQAASAWNIQTLSVNPPQGPIAPKTPVVVTGILHFGPVYKGLSTFINDDTFDMYTELTDPRWNVTKVETFDDRPAEITKIFENKRSVRARIDGWELSYGRRSFELEFRLEGTAPEVSETQSKIIIRIQELDPSANPVDGTVTLKKYTIAVPTPTLPPDTPSPTAPPTTAPPAGTPAPDTPAPTASITQKQTYSPGPEGGLVVGLLILVFIAAALKRKNP